MRDSNPRGLAPNPVPSLPGRSTRAHRAPGGTSNVVVVLRGREIVGKFSEAAAVRCECRMVQCWFTYIRPVLAAGSAGEVDGGQLDARPGQQ
ncbi:MAG TPA: hypothetical protein VJ820_01090 [Propionibacteriaceae bacterium]|nr:hypothetical protein [Propionibacteriaceae bacterium]